MYFIPVLSPDIKMKEPYLIIERVYWLSNCPSRYYHAEVSKPYQGYTILSKVYEYNTRKNKFEPLLNKIQLHSPSLTFFKAIPMIIPKLYQRMFHHIIRKIIGDECFTYFIFIPVKQHDHSELPCSFLKSVSF
jgi:hypothetical protein